MKILDLYCGAGGASMGYHLAGFDVYGIDIVPQKNYPFFVMKKDALDVDPFWIANNFDAVHASPPCQQFTTLNNYLKKSYPNLIEATRDLLLATGLPWIMENVIRAPLRRDLMLCGSMFGLGSGERYLMRHRVFEIEGFEVVQPKCNHKVGSAIGVYGHGGACDNVGSERRGGYQGSLRESREAMGIDWMSSREISQAIPPAYTEYIGESLAVIL